MRDYVKQNIRIYLLFWALYGPLVFLNWMSSEGSLVYLGFVLLIGLGIVLGGILVKERLLDRPRYARTRIRLREDPIQLEDEDEEPGIELSREHIPDFDEYRNFRTLFTDGGGAP
ncbi:hypothetical protein ACFL0V_02200 [Nanoarchaeota archaeon]